MDLHSMWDMVNGLGLGVTLSVAGFIMLFFIIKWVLNVSQEQLQMMAREREQNAIIMSKEREQFAIIIRGFIEQLQIINTANKAFAEQVNEAHKYQREEHKDMIQCLGRINGYKHD